MYEHKKRIIPHFFIKNKKNKRKEEDHSSHYEALITSHLSSDQDNYDQDNYHTFTKQ